MSRDYVPSTSTWRLTTPTRYANLDMPKKFPLIRLANKIGLGKPKSSGNIPCKSLNLSKSSGPVRLTRLDYALDENLATSTCDEAKQSTVMYLRDHLPELVAYEEVAFDLNNNVWTVEVSSSRFPSPLQLPAFIAGCPVRISDGKMNHPDYCRGFSIHPERPALYTREETDLTQHVPEEAVWLIARHFPMSIGFRVFFHGVAYGKRVGTINILYSSFKHMKQDINSLLKSEKLPSQICDLYYDFKVVDITLAENLNIEEGDRFRLLQEHIQTKAALVEGSDYLYDCERTSFREAILYRSEITAFDGKSVSYDYSSTTMRQSLVGSTPSVFRYKGVFVPVLKTNLVKEQFLSTATTTEGGIADYGIYVSNPPQPSSISSGSTTANSAQLEATSQAS